MIAILTCIHVILTWMGTVPCVYHDRYTNIHVILTWMGTAPCVYHDRRPAARTYSPCSRGPARGGSSRCGTPRVSECRVVLVAADRWRLR